MKRLTAFFLYLFLGTSPALHAQAPDSIAFKKEPFKKVLLDSSFVENLSDTTMMAMENDSTKSSKKGRKPKEDRFLHKIFTKGYPNPKTAMLLSFALPGTGQIYNRRWWKPPLVYAGMGWSIYSIVQNTNQYKRYRDAYILKLAGEPHEFSGTRFDNVTDLKRVRNGFDKNRQLSFVAAILVYGIQGAEAFVDAHLRTFDVSDDLSLRMRINPALDMDYLYGTSVGIGLTFQLDKRVEVPKMLVSP